MSIAANATITGRLIGCIDSRDTTITSGIYMTLFPRVTCPAQCCIARHHCIVKWCHLVSPRICTLHAAQGARLPVCTVQHSVLLLLLLLLIRSSWQKSLQDKMVKLISLKLTLKFLGSSNILQTRQEQIKHNSGASILAAELLWWWRGEVSRVTSGPCLHVSMSPLVLQKVPSEGL